VGFFDPSEETDVGWFEEVCCCDGEDGVLIRQDGFLIREVGGGDAVGTVDPCEFTREEDVCCESVADD
jgi:hypothetical protein